MCIRDSLVDDRAVAARLLQHDAVDIALGQACREICNLDLEAERARAALDHGDGLREEVRIEHGATVRHSAVRAAHEQHSFGPVSYTHLDVYKRQT